MPVGPVGLAGHGVLLFDGAILDWEVGPWDLALPLVVVAVVSVACVPLEIAVVAVAAAVELGFDLEHDIETSQLH